MKCETCDGKGWFATGETNNPIQLQCQFCLGTGIIEEKIDSEACDDLPEFDGF